MRWRWASGVEVGGWGGGRRVGWRQASGLNTAWAAARLARERRWRWKRCGASGGEAGGTSRRKEFPASEKFSSRTQPLGRKKSRRIQVVGDTLIDTHTHACAPAHAARPRLGHIQRRLHHVPRAASHLRPDSRRSWRERRRRLAASDRECLHAGGSGDASWRSAAPHWRKPLRSRAVAREGSPDRPSKILLVQVGTLSSFGLSVFPFSFFVCVTKSKASKGQG